MKSKGKKERKEERKRTWVKVEIISHKIKMAIYYIVYVL